MPSHNVEHTEAFPLTVRGLRDAFRFWKNTPYRSHPLLAIQTTQYPSALPIRFRDRGDERAHGYSGVVNKHHVGRPLLLIVAESPLRQKGGVKIR
ncbi:hypothetical protein KBC80_04375 [Candidatus Woesebacteria bacterium]|jgi:hypothetical protein|nr:hypothetical protein [Candidatus Woesebacteria bacterium]